MVHYSFVSFLLHYLLHDLGVSVRFIIVKTYVNSNLHRHLVAQCHAAVNIVDRIERQIMQKLKNTKQLGLLN